MPILDKVALLSGQTGHKPLKDNDYYDWSPRTLQTDSGQLFTVKPVVIRFIAPFAKTSKKAQKRRFFGLVDLFNYISIKLIIFI
ncbi:hypothetical protein CS310_07490 [Lactiplantibacillus plantarum]|nr:hypothetical protein CS310_07490 [Lactiplantibacillus plantarum]